MKQKDQQENLTSKDTVCIEDYDMIAWEMSRLVKYLKEYYNVTDEGIGKIIYG